MVWRRGLIWSGRVVSAGSVVRAKRALAAERASASGAVKRARLAAVSRSRVAWPLPRAASSRSSSAISSSTFATIRRCSARGGRGNGTAATKLPETSLKVVPGAFVDVGRESRVSHVR